MSRITDFIESSRPETLQSVQDLFNLIRRENINFHASPRDWRDEVLYFLLPDRFSDGEEQNRHVLSQDQIARLRSHSDRPDWNWKQ